MLATHDPPADAALAEPVDLDGGDRREVARQQRQHARRDHRDETREERDRQLLSHRSARAPRRPAARPRAPSATGAGARGSARVRDHTRAPSASATAPTSDAAERQHPREQVEAVRSRRREDRRAELGDHRVEDLLFGLARGDPLLHLGLHLARDLGVRLVERRVARRADEQRLESPLARVLSCRRPREPRGQARARATATSLTT